MMHALRALPNCTSGASELSACIGSSMAVMQIVELTGLSWPAARAAIDLYEAAVWPRSSRSRAARPPPHARSRGS